MEWLIELAAYKCIHDPYTYVNRKTDRTIAGQIPTRPCDLQSRPQCRSDIDPTIDSQISLTEHLLMQDPYMAKVALGN